MKFLVISLLCVFTLFNVSSARNIGANLRPKKDFGGRIIGGEPAAAGQFSSAAAIYVSTADGTFFCGGALISQEWILTAANCIQGGVAFQIVLGSNALDDPNRVTVTTSTYINHPDFNLQTLENDIGLIQLRAPIEYTDYIKRIYLTTKELDDDMAITAIGWGSGSDASASLTNELQYVAVTSISNDICQLSYSNTIFDSMVCVAGNNNEGTCRGDNGGPLITSLANLQWHMGVASFISTNGCETPDPAGFTRTWPYVDWIKTTTGIA